MGNSRTKISYIWLLTEKGTKLFLGLFISTLIARYLGPDNYGMITYATTYVMAFQIIAALGLEAITLRELSKPGDSTTILGTSIGMRLLAGTACYAAAVSLAFATEDKQTIGLIGLIGITILSQAFEISETAYQATNNLATSTRLKVATYISISAVKFAAVQTNQDVFTFAALTGIEPLIYGAILLTQSKKITKIGTANFSKETAKKLLGESYPYMLTSLSIMAYMRIDQFFIKGTLGNHMLGVYGAAFVITTLTHFVPTTLLTAALPRTTQLYEQSPTRDYEKYTRTLLKFYISIGIFFAITLATLAPIIVSTLYGAKYAEATTILRILAFTTIPICLGLWHSILLIVEGRGGISLIKTLIGASASIVCNLTLLPKLGLIGAALSSVISQFTAAILSNAILDKKAFKMQIEAMTLSIFARTPK